MATHPAHAAAGLLAMTASIRSIGYLFSGREVKDAGYYDWQPPVANGVQQRAAIEPDVCELAVVEFHQPVEVAPNDASVRDLLESSLGGTDHDRP